MKIALVIENSINSPGGVEILTRELLRGLGKRFEVFLATPDDDCSLESHGVHGNGLNDHYRIDPTKDSWRDDLVKWLAARSLDICHIQSGGTYAWGSGGRSPSLIFELVRRGVRCINTNHQTVSPWDVDFRGIHFTRRLTGFLRRWPAKARSLSMTEREVMVSDHDLLIASRCYPFHAHKMLRIYHSRIDPDMALEPMPESRRIVSLATIAPRKGQAVLVESFCRVAHLFPEWTLHLYGMLHDQVYISLIKKTISGFGLGNRVFIEGPTVDHLAVLAGAEIYVQPSYLEALGLSLQEALFLGKACIGSKIGGIPELIENNVSGILCFPGDVAGLSNALTHLMNHQSERFRMGAEGKRRVTNLGMNREQMAKAYINLYHQLN
jgi:glycosyltransferase involved in cell wall biosynthesis